MFAGLFSLVEGCFGFHGAFHESRWFAFPGIPNFKQLDEGGRTCPSHLISRLGGAATAKEDPAKGVI